MTTNRRDYVFPFRIDRASGRAAESSYEAHVEQMIEQVLLTAPGERVDLPEFGCGLRNLIFAPNDAALATTTQVIVSEALNRWLGNQIQVSSVAIAPAETEDQMAEIRIRIDYVLIETRTNRSAEVTVL